MLSFEVIFHAINPRKQEIIFEDRNITVETIPLKHKVPMYHESTYTKEFESRCKDTTHSTAQQAAQIAKEAEVKHLLIGHFSARVDDHQVFLNEALEVFANTRLAEERKTFEF